VAFVKHTTVSEITDGKRRETWARNTLSGDYELLCRDGESAQRIYCYQIIYFEVSFRSLLVYYEYNPRTSKRPSFFKKYFLLL